MMWFAWYADSSKYRQDIKEYKSALTQKINQLAVPDRVKAHIEYSLNVWAVVQYGKVAMRQSDLMLCLFQNVR